MAGDEAELAAYRKAWDALAAMDERLERLRSQESSARQQADYLRESIDRINRIDPQPGEDEELKARRERIENAADIAQGVGSALGALDASQVDVDAADGASAVELINHAVTSLRAIRVGGTFSEQADRLESINADLGDVVFALSQELGDEGSVEDLDQINGRIHELGDLARRGPPWPTCSLGGTRRRSIWRIWMPRRKRSPNSNPNGRRCTMRPSPPPTC